MAKKPIEEVEETIVEETIAENTAAEVGEDNEVKPAPKAARVKAPSEKLVKIRTVEDVSSRVSQIHYQLQKDKEYSVPSDVAAILCHSRKAFRI